MAWDEPIHCQECGGWNSIVVTWSVTKREIKLANIPPAYKQAAQRLLLKTQSVIFHLAYTSNQPNTPTTLRAQSNNQYRTISENHNCKLLQYAVPAGYPKAFRPHPPRLNPTMGGKLAAACTGMFPPASTKPSFTTSPKAL
jgi:hypothetical protein